MEKLSLHPVLYDIFDQNYLPKLLHNFRVDTFKPHQCKTTNSNATLMWSARSAKTGEHSISCASTFDVRLRFLLAVSRRYIDKSEQISASRSTACGVCVWEGVTAWVMKTEQSGPYVDGDLLYLLTCDPNRSQSLAICSTSLGACTQPFLIVEHLQFVGRLCAFT